MLESPKASRKRGFSVAWPAPYLGPMVDAVARKTGVRVAQYSWTHDSGCSLL